MGSKVRHFLSREEYEAYDAVDPSHNIVLDVIWYDDDTHRVCQAVRNPDGSLKMDGFRRGIETIMYQMTLLIVHSDTGEEFDAVR